MESSGIIAALVSVGAITLAEMGDKTQLLAMAFATKFKFWKVLCGILVATVLNHALAVALGSFLTRYRDLDIAIQTVAALSFVFFGLWTLRGDRLEGEQDKPSRFGPLATVAVAFFLAEMGDKTQLTTLALAAKYPTHPALVLLGTTTGMLIADGFGIVFGVLLCRRIPERKVKLISAAVFIVFGFLATHEVCTVDFRFPGHITAVVLGLLAAGTAAAAGWILLHQDRSAGYAGVPELQSCDDEKERA